jgi:PIN domain nuclease of toxin-antitoxin system
MIECMMAVTNPMAMRADTESQTETQRSKALIAAASAYYLATMYRIGFGVAMNAELASYFARQAERFGVSHETYHAIALQLATETYHHEPVANHLALSGRFRK